MLVTRNLVRKGPDVARQSRVEMMARNTEMTLRMAGIKPSKPQDPMWYLMSHGKFVGYVKVFREERYARNWFRDLSEKDASRNGWAYWRDGYPIMLIEGGNTRDANQFVKLMAICREEPSRLKLPLKMDGRIGVLDI